jgi:hypothetical protein
VVEPAPVPPEAFDVPWLADLLDVPDGASWPRLMSAPHPAAVGSYGELVDASSARFRGGPPRWWQRLVSRRLLEHDADGRLVWAVALLTVARQVGKSWELGDLAWWRAHAAELFAAEQTVVSTGKELGVLREVARPFVGYGLAHRGAYTVSRVNGYEGITERASGSRWLVRAQSAVYGLTATFATVDEAWSVPASVVDDGLEPTTVSRTDAQILLVSTAHRRATALMAGRRASALDNLSSGDGPLLLEWSAAPDAPLDDRDGWRAASPYWSPERERLIARRLDGALAGESADADEPDPLVSFRTQWLNQWPAKRLTPTKGDPLVDLDTWAALDGPVADNPDRLFVAVEDHAGLGAALAVVAVQDDGRLGLEGWTVPTWDDALSDLAALRASHDRVTLCAGASLLVRLPTGIRAAYRGTSQFTRTTLPLVRELVTSGVIVHDSDELFDQVDEVRVTDAIGGLSVVAGHRSDLLRAASWALAMAANPTRTPTIR